MDALLELLDKVNWGLVVIVGLFLFYTAVAMSDGVAYLWRRWIKKSFPIS